MIVIPTNKIKFLWISHFYLGSAVLELSKLHMYEKYCDKLQPYVGQENKMYSFKCGDHFKKILKSVSTAQRKHIKFEEYKNFSVGEKYEKECNI